jgi:hypothetical protein
MFPAPFSFTRTELRLNVDVANSFGRVGIARSPHFCAARSRLAQRADDGPKQAAVSICFTASRSEAMSILSALAFACVALAFACSALAWASARSTTASRHCHTVAAETHASALAERRALTA